MVAKNVDVTSMVDREGMLGVWWGKGEGEESVHGHTGGMGATFPSSLRLDWCGDPSQQLLLHHCPPPGPSNPHVRFRMEFRNPLSLPYVELLLDVNLDRSRGT